jgi:hypothetical protein
MLTLVATLTLLFLLSPHPRRRHSFYSVKICISFYAASWTEVRRLSLAYFIFKVRLTKWISTKCKIKIFQLKFNSRNCPYLVVFIVKFHTPNVTQIEFYQGSRNVSKYKRNGMLHRAFNCVSHEFYLKLLPVPFSKKIQHNLSIISERLRAEV